MPLQPTVDALDVEEVAARPQPPQHVGGLVLRQAYCAARLGFLPRCLRVRHLRAARQRRLVDAACCIRRRLVVVPCSAAELEESDDDEEQNQDHSADRQLEAEAETHPHHLNAKKKRRKKLARNSISQILREN